MSTELRSCLGQLKSCLDTQQVPRARSVIASITQLIVETTTESQAETEYALECLLDAPNSLIAFLQRSFSNAKQLAKVNEDVFELFRKMIEKHSALLRKWMGSIVSITLRFIQSSAVTARERELATLVLQDGIAYGSLQKDSYERLGLLVEELLEVFQHRKLPNRFQQNMYELLGQLAKHFPECVTEPDRLRDAFLSTAESQLLEENYPSLVSLAGAIRGLDMFLFHFAPSHEDKEMRQRLYLLVKKLSICDESRSERIVFRNALQLLADHSQLFTMYLYEDHVHWQTVLAGRWIKSSNRDDRQVALTALYAFHREVARVLSYPESVSESQRECPRTKDVLNQYLAYYRKLLNSTSTERWEMRIAIRGFGIMAGPCRRVSGSSVSLNDLLTDVLDRIEGICGRPSAGDMLEYLPDFMQALSEIMTHALEISTVQLASVQTMLVALIRDFYHLPSVHHELIVKSLLCTLENIGKLGGNALEHLLDNVFLQGIIWSCTHSLPYDQSAPSTGNDTSRPYDWKRELVTYKAYLPLWQGLLEKCNKNVDQSPMEDATLSRAIYSTLMRTLFVIVEKLDLSTRKRSFRDELGKQRELFFCDPNLDLIPNKPKDFHIFLNLVDLYREVMFSVRTAVREMFVEWIRRYFEQFVKLSLRHPLVSGFVKLIEMGLETAESIGYFTRTNDRETQHGMLLVFYLESTIRSALQATGELQLACLRFVLNTPARLLMAFLDDQQKRQQPPMVAVFQITFRLGRGLLSIARIGLGCLERIVHFNEPPVRPDQRESLLRQVLPMLEPYLQARDSTQSAAVSLRLAKFKRQRTANLTPGRIERIKQQHRIEQYMEMSELVAFQMRVLHFLGELQPNECCWMVPEDGPIGGALLAVEEPSLVRWDADSERSIELRLLCASGSRPCVKLDSIIGRVCLLAVESSDRATKLAACELLHTLVLYLLGIHYQDQLHGLWSQLCRHMLRLSCDTDLAVCQMFEPLLFQIIHYLTQPSKLSQQGTSVLLDCLLNATSNAQNTAIRDLAVRGLREFLQWTNRQSGTSRSLDDRMKAKRTLLEALKTYALESDTSRRYGAALAFNNLFRLLAQDDGHLVRYWFELTHALAVGFCMTEEQQGVSEGSGGGGLAQFELALDHAVKILEQRRVLFNGQDVDPTLKDLRQIVPPAIGGGELQHLVCWLFRQCAARQRVYRRKCMQLFPRLAAAVRDVTNGVEFLQKYYTPELVDAVCLHSGIVQGCGQTPTLEILRERTMARSPVNDVHLWLEYFLATLDIICWLLQEKLLPEETSRQLLTRVLPVVQYFLRTLVHATMQELLDLVNLDHSMEVDSASSPKLRMNADKLVRYDALKAALVVQIVELLAIVLDSANTEGGFSEDRMVIDLMEDHSTVGFILKLLFESQQFGLDCSVPAYHELDADRRLWKLLEALVLQLTNRQSSFARELSEKVLALAEGFSDRIDALLLQRTIGETDQKNVKGLLFIAKLQQQSVDGSKALMYDYQERLHKVAHKLLDACYKNIAQNGARVMLAPSAARWGTGLLQALFGLSTVGGDRVDETLLNRTVQYSLNCVKLQPNIRHGQHFVSCFGPAIFGLFLANPSACMAALLDTLIVDNFLAIVQFLCGLMEYLYRTHPGEGERLRKLTEAILLGWDCIYKCSRAQANRFGEVDLQLIELMGNVAMVCPFPLHEISTKTGPTYERWIIELLGTASNPIALKSKAIVLLPTLLSAEERSDAQGSGPLEDALEVLQTTHFPLRSTEFSPNSPQRAEFINCLERLLDALVVSCSPLLLRAIIQMTAPDGEGNVAERQVRDAIERFFGGQTTDMQCSRLQEIWTLFENHSYAPTVRATVLKRYLCTGLWRCSYDTITAFYRRNIRSISEMANVELLGRSGWDLEHALVDRAAAFRLVEQYAALLPKTMLLAENCTVAGELYEAGTGEPVRAKRLIGDFSKRAYNVRAIPFRTEDPKVAELYRQFQCAAYRALVALISNTNDNARMYSVLIFRETRDKGEFLWRLLIHCSNDATYLESGQEFDETPRIIEKRVAIRREDLDATTRSDRGLDSVVAESSLSQQVSRFDLNNSVMLSAREVALREATELSKRQKGTLSRVSLERSKINDHEVMATVCGCIRHMATAGITTEPIVRFIVDSLIDPGQPKNVRLFLAKVIDNCRRELTNHAALLLAPLMQLIVDGQIFNGLNTLVTDLIALILEWSTRRPPLPAPGVVDESASLASALLRFLMKHCCQQLGSSVRQQVFRLNLELIRALIQQWHDVLTIPTELLFVMVTNRDVGSSQSEDRSQFELAAGIQLSTIVLINGGGRLVPWSESNREDYLRAVLECLDAPNNTIYKPAAQLLGLCLARLYPAGVPEDQQEPAGSQGADGEDFLTCCINLLSNINRGQGRKFLEIVYEISKGFPSIADPFLSIVSFRIPTASAAEKRIGLELLLGGRIERFRNELYRELVSLDLAQLLRDADLQLTTLHLLNRALPVLVDELQEIQQLIDPVGGVATQRTTQPASRAVAYEILIYIHQHRAGELSDEKRQAVWKYLLQGLCETDDTTTDSTLVSSVRTRVLEYLMESGKLPEDVRERFLYLLTELYDPSIEAEFLGSAVALLFDPAIRCRESKDRLFLHEYISTDVKFREYTIETGSRQRHSATVLTPLFAETSSQRQLQTYITGRGSQMEQMIKATQFSGVETDNSEFEPTQDPTRYTLAGDSFALPTQNSLLFEASSLQLDRRSQRKAGGGFTPEEEQVPNMEERTFERLRKRILKDSEANRQRQTSWAVGRHYSTQRKRTEQRRAGSSRVTLYRRYRLADYPDLQINLLAFLLPLQALCRRDAACARQTFVAIFNGIADDLTGEQPGPRVEWDRFVQRLDRSLQHILESTKACDPNLFGSLIELSLGKASGRLTLSPRNVASVAGVSNMLTMGVLYVEGKLTDGSEFDEQSVRAGGSHASSEADHWLQLSSLYHTLREHDAVAGIFGDKLDSNPRLRDAIEMEALGQYDQAYRAYSELIATTSPARVEERNFCYKSAYDCLMRLGQWDVLLEEIGGQVTGHDELWTDEWNQDNLLPAYMHGNVRLNMAGDERGREFCRILDEWMHMPPRAEHIQQHFGEELTALNLASGELVRARLYAEQTERQFLEEWHCAGVLSDLFRVECLLGVRKVVELRAYSELLEGRGEVKRLVDSWRQAKPNVTDSLITWDTIVAHRRFLVEQLEKKSRETPDGETTHLSQLSELLFELELHLLEVAFEQSNMIYAGKMIQRLRGDEADGAIKREQLLRRRIARMRYDRARLTRASPTDPSQLLKGFRRLAHLTTQSALEHLDEPPVPKAMGAAWAELFHYGESFHDRVNDAVLDVIRVTAGNAIRSERPNEALRQFTVHCLQQSIDAIRSGLERGGTSPHELADAYFRMAQYSYEQLDTEQPEQVELPAERQLVTSLLPAIQYGSREARQLFPVLLQLRNLHNGKLRQEFDELSRSVPSWNFLPWIPQLLSYLKVKATDVQTDGGGGSFLDELLLRLATDYPMALYFPARITLEQHGSVSERPFIGRFRAALKHPTMDRFVDELCRVVMPEMRLLAMLTGLWQKLTTFSNPEDYRAYIERAVENVFPVEASDNRYGKAYRALCPYVVQWLSLRDLHPDTEQEAIKERLRGMESALKALRPRAQQHRVQLEDLSPWLADYHYSGQQLDETIELPGQYNTMNERRPTPGVQVRLVKVFPDLIVYGTLRLPVLIAFRGSDGRQYRFLAKYGEDLRQDQRIQQLQQVITNHLRLDRRCMEQRLELRTYQVVPIRSDFGMIEWLEGTVSLQQIAAQAGPRYNPSNDRGQAYVRDQYAKFLRVASKRVSASVSDEAVSRLDSQALYGQAASHCPPARFRLKYIELSQTIRGDTLKRALFDMTTSPEAFYRLRMNFGRSLAAMDITCWVLGIGDRHLSNIVLERATGDLVGVDFGIAFGAGTRDLGVPELVPFRLTPQFVGVMEPMRLSGVLHKCHLYTLQCLRDARKLLRACLDVFIREPTVDWLEAARARSTGGEETGGPSTAHGSTWHPESRVETVIRKLSGANPKRLLLEELRQGVIAGQRNFLLGYRAIVQAATELSSKLAEESDNPDQLSTEMQVGMLLELATDEKLLGIAYSGWYPWF
ncbi:DNA-dependent protein kinase catalytic subunit-like [Anopheles ziemanni]|uniref:DNA-dependent protein kinase catalytic subunit-like n=1 Tax=Anopheles coustani TaxID=139045 RepID=UPI00265AA8E3|nr:DNA-dependent protein kinase catalytic subunit-like [Anopheles coustani]XP_058170868.1 DNA-dependent protein kinase catalytic subunit-like [Anopheles ziemanni]